ncbi:MAG TPA: hypothetical protein VH227_03480 [Candidatus Udaeobacter sp.]|jgi:hypothetical protein|nr:hypothetical protein [Candidatus Udaeobacter sp.]
MKKIFILSTLISLSMTCSCQKQNTAAEQRLSQREAALDAREKALDEREKALAESKRAATNPRAIRPELHTRRPVADPAQIQAERQRRIQQLPPEFRALIPDASQIQAGRAEKTTRPQDPGAETQRNVSGGVQSGQTPSAQADANSPTPSPTPQ